MTLRTVTQLGPGQVPGGGITPAAELEVLHALAVDDRADEAGVVAREHVGDRRPRPRDGSSAGRPPSSSRCWMKSSMSAVCTAAGQIAWMRTPQLERAAVPALRTNPTTACFVAA